MESKLLTCHNFASTSPFNRTSMESKLFEVVACALDLLIEPVWNRNCAFAFVVGRLRLLIEPVWNRNFCLCIPIGRTTSFNRTSMESKQARLAGRVSGVLLIEPVWNRNRS